MPSLQNLTVGQSGTMGCWALPLVSFLLLLCTSVGQVPHRRRHWPGTRNIPHLDLPEFHGNPKDRISNEPWFIVVAPDLLRADSPENIYLEAGGLRGQPTVSISIRDYTRSIVLYDDTFIMDSEQGGHTLRSIQLPSDLLEPEDLRNRYVYLGVNFHGYHLLEKVIMVSFQQGYIFVQTDKPIYNPGDTVRMRAYVSSSSFKASNSTLMVEFQNPEGVVVKQTMLFRPADGVLPESFILSDHANEGVWAVITKFDARPQNTFRAQFQVKKYVLPAFNVTLVPSSPYLGLDHTRLEVAVSARYLYGEPVQGTAYVVFGLVINNEMKRLPSVKQVSDLDGGLATLTMEEIRRAYPDLRSLVGSSVYVKASVLTASGSDLVEASKTNIRIVDSPYILTFSHLPQYFKPGMPFDFTIQLNYQDGSPASDVLMKVDLVDSVLSTSAAGSLRVNINMPRTSGPQTITVETAEPGQRSGQQARQQTTVLPYQPFSRSQQNFLYIAATNSMTAGNTLRLLLVISPADSMHLQLIKHLTYLVISKGKILQARRLSVEGQVHLAVTLRVTQDMRPSFRVVAYYTLPWLRHMEVVSDSIWVDLDDGCVGGLHVGPEDGRHRDLLPGKTFRFKVRGDPGAKVNLVAVDNAVFLLSKERLTQSKMWSAVEKGDMGCTRGGGKDGMGVFKDAGLLFSSSLRANTSPRQGLGCPASARKRRSAELWKRKAQLEAQYREELQRRCCQAGLRDVAMPYSCTRRSLYITEGWECIRAFRDCCAHLRGQSFDTSRPTNPPPLTTTPPPLTTTTPPPTTTPLRFPFGQPLLREVHHTVEDVLHALRRPPSHSVLPGHSGHSEPQVFQRPGSGTMRTVVDDDEEEGEYMAEYDVYLRSKFYESWLWRDVRLPDTPDGRDGLASITMTTALPDSITEWSVMAISASHDTGFCVAKPYNVKAWKKFFVDLKLPYSVARHEQIQIKAVLRNYGQQRLHVRVVLMVTEGICSVAFSEQHTQEVDLPAGGTVVVPYTLVPLVVGKLPVQVMVLGRDLMGGDRVEKILRVVLEGVQKTLVRSFVLDPSAHGGTQNIHPGKVELESVVPNSLPLTLINIRGSVLADSIDNSISDDSLASLIRMPGGCVEQNLAGITLPLIATLYLDSTHGWESVGVQRRVEAIGYITKGYEKQLAYRKSDGSYPPYRKEGTSTWITAFVVKVFSMAYSLVRVEQQQVCGALLYLLNEKQEHDGGFREDNPVYTTTMTGGLRGSEAKTTLTAFVVIALAQARKAKISCGGISETATHNAANYLKRELSRPLKRPYTVAISAYALTLLGQDPSYNPITPLLNAVSEGSYWADSESPLFSLEATGYGLLALLEGGHLDEAVMPFNWLNSKRRRGGGYGSTQPTMVVLQALSEYLLKRAADRDVSLQVDLKVPGRTDLRYHFEPQTSYVARSSRAPLDQEFEVEAQGNGQGILELVTFYNQLHEVEEKSLCPHFELEVATEESSETPPADVIKSYQITIRVRALAPRDVRMVVLDISLPTGFTPDNSDLEMLSNSVDRYINNFQVVDNLSDRGSLIIHLFKVSHREPEILIFRLQQNFKVGLLQPSSVTVYEYYNPADHRCSRTYSPPEDKEALGQICRNDVCRCTQGDCCVSKSDSETIPVNNRTRQACESLHYVYKVKVLSVNQSYYDRYEMEITQVIKLGLEPDVADGVSRLFMSHGGCRDHLHLQQGSHYFIMGPKADLWHTDTGFVYMLGKKTWVERWPSEAECTSDAALQAKCTVLEAAARDLSINGCRQ
ncbi:complement C3-like isoform X4 [Gadus chalcogrammus]|uniref:complement C3-like isoform X4 n=1 Tax=Gadus chalcogrammus TaxID=1042646 RepID=UPI0024C4349B|nr:complement C3-like isoform X4 [Gadus chalcogrammus]